RGSAGARAAKEACRRARAAHRTRKSCAGSLEAEVHWTAPCAPRDRTKPQRAAATRGSSRRADGRLGATRFVRRRAFTLDGLRGACHAIDMPRRASTVDDAEDEPATAWPTRRAAALVLGALVLPLRAQPARPIVGFL